MTIDVLLHSDIFDVPTDADLSAFQNLSFDHIAILNIFNTAPHSWTPSAISASAIVFASGTGYTLTVTGSGLSPITSFADLETAFQNGIASGTLSSFVFTEDSSSTDFMSFTLTSGGYTFASGNQSIEFSGSTPTSLEQFYDLAVIAGQLANVSSLSNLEISEIISDLSAYEIDGITISDNGTDLLELAFSDTSLSITVAGYTFAINGTFPDNAGEDLQLVLEIAALLDAGSPFNFSDISNLAVSNLTITAPDNTVLFLTSGAIVGDSSDVIGDVYVDGILVNNWVLGTLSDDTLNGTTGSDHIVGLSENDIFCP